jgi:hypothetical protein
MKIQIKKKNFIILIEKQGMVIFFLNYLYNNSRSEICTEKISMGEFGVYDLMVSGNMCKVETSLDPVNANLALLYSFLILLLLGIAFR